MLNFIRLAFKNAFRNKKRAMTLGINYTVVTILLLLVLSFSNGVRVTVSSSLVRGTAGHLTFSGEYVTGRRAYLGIKKYPEITQTIKNLYPDASILARYSFSSDLYYNGVSKRLSFTGIDVQNDSSYQNELFFREGNWNVFTETENAVIIPKSVADYFELKNGEDVLLSRRTRFGAFNTGILKIAGIHETENYFLKDLVLCHFDYLQSVDLANDDTATTLFVYFPDTANIAEKREQVMVSLGAQGFVVSRPQNSTDAINAVAAASPKYAIEDTDTDVIRLTVSTIDEVLSIMANILFVVNSSGIFIAGILLFIIAVSIFINLRMTINERMKEIGTMRTIGLERSGIIGLFVLENTALAAIFSAAGILVSIGVIFLLRLIVFPPNSSLAIILNESRLVFIPTLLDTGIVFFIIAAFTAFFSFFPARYGGRIKPVDALNSTF
ncbi:MAG: FtsX-like permease family protein [Spirochaetales bacterium]|nr:FtsX-like permease family protein [Spirochaetales bacterium]